MTHLRTLQWRIRGFEGTVRLAVAVAATAAVAALAANSAMLVAAAAAPAPPGLPKFQSCVLAFQGAALHAMRLNEARHCESGLPEIPQSKVDSLGFAGKLPATYLVVRGTNAVLEWTSFPTAQLVASRTINAISQSCYNTWTYPDPSWWTAIDWGNLNTGGYGNHCGYANVPSTPTFSTTCVCTGVSKSAGRADSTWDSTHYGVNAALGWGNVTFYEPIGSDTYACRAWVSTVGTQNPSAWCN